ncbi:MAG TPA: GNAT family N-acetyltransferase [Rhizomicrobium sp.]|nr:GNAT family N-acetyltransferase [Rhizomicrobium sp.]
MSDIEIRRAKSADVSALLEIYNHYILKTPITFDIEPRTLAQRRDWLDHFAAAGRYQCFVASVGGETIGWACSTKFKEREAYATSVETSVYCAPGFTGRGIGRQLYATLFEALKGEDIHRAYGGITQPNEASNRLHLALGFRLIGTYGEVGRKFGRYWDVAIYERLFA